MMNKLISVNVMMIMFFLSGIDKMINFYKISNEFTTKTPVKIPIQIAYLAIVVAIIIELAAPILINVGLIKKNKKLVLYSTLFLIVFTVLATLLYHFPPIGYQYYPFMSNLTTIGGLMLILYI